MHAVDQRTPEKDSLCSRSNQIVTTIGPVEMRDIASLTLPNAFLRKYTEKHKRRFARVVETFGCIVPIGIDQNGTVLTSMPWLLGAIKLGLTEVPTIRHTHLSEHHKTALRIVDQRLNELTPWDEKALALEFKQLLEVDLDFDIDVLGFSDAEIDLHIEKLELIEEDYDDNSVPRLPSKNAISQAGDLWILGRHRLLCGSALNKTSFVGLMENKKADVVFTDPPYNLKIDGHVSGNGKVIHREFPMASGELSNTEFTQFLTEAVSHLISHSKDGSLAYICMDWRHAANLLLAGQQFSSLKNICVWVKNKAGMGSFYRSRHELVFVFKNGNQKHQNNVELGKYGRDRSNVWEYASPGMATRTNPEDASNFHPTVKPVKLIADALLDCSKRHGIVLDPFLGSGATLLAAERIGRKCRGIEIDPLYVDLTVRQWQALTGEHAVLESSDESFDEVATRLETSHV